MGSALPRMRRRGTGSQTQNTGAQSSASPSPAAGSQGSSMPSAGSQQAGAQLATGKGLLLLACDSQLAGGTTQVTLHTSAGGARWRVAGTVQARGRPTALTSAVAGQVVLATTSGIEYSANGGRTWQAASFTGTGSGKSGPAGGFTYVGMTNASQGVAVPAKATLGDIYVTSNGGKTWSAAPVSGTG